MRLKGLSLLSLESEYSEDLYPFRRTTPNGSDMHHDEGERIADCANVLADWLGVRDMSELTRAALEREAGLADGVADLFVLFGGGVIGTVETLAVAMRAGVARRYAIVGGRGHATYGLEETMRAEMCNWPQDEASTVDPASASEAEMLAAVLAHRHGLSVDLLETRSTNCGNNIAYLLDLLDKDATPPASVILSQDAAMQRRMVATWQRQVEGRPRYANVKVVSWASYRTQLVWRDGHLSYDVAPEGMWDTDRYLSLLMGDVSRLTDDEHGYGPNGAGFVAHVNIPDEVRQAWDELGLLRPHDDRIL